MLLSLTRQGLPAFERTVPFEPRDVWNGAYTVSDPAEKANVVLLATGSEVALAVDAAALLAEDGVRARVVSMPSVDLFLARSDADQEAILPDDGTPIVAIEAGRGESLRRLVGHRGLIYGIDTFGASAPYADLAAHYGFTPDQLSARVLELL